jgi:hypothetical protein
MNAFRMTYALSWTVGPALAAFTLREASFRGLFLVAAALHVVFFGLAFRFVGPATALRASPSTLPVGSSLPKEPAPKPPPPPANPKALWRDPAILPWYLALITAFAAQAISMSNMSLYVIEELAGSERHVGIIFSLAPLFELPFMPYFGLLATRVPAERLIRAGFLIGLLYYAGLVLARAPWHVYPLQILSAAMVAITSGVAITFFQDKLPQRLGAATNLYVNAIRLGSTSGYLLFGSVAGSIWASGGVRGLRALVARSARGCPRWRFASPHPPNRSTATFHLTCVATEAACLAGAPDSAGSLCFTMILSVSRKCAGIGAFVRKRFDNPGVRRRPAYNVGALSPTPALP